MIVAAEGASMGMNFGRWLRVFIVCIGHRLNVRSMIDFFLYMIRGSITANKAVYKHKKYHD